MKRIWCIVSYQAGQLAEQGFPIESSIGKPYRELLSIARRMNRNGEGSRYAALEFKGRSGWDVLQQRAAILPPNR